MESIAIAEESSNGTGNALDNPASESRSLEKVLASSENSHTYDSFRD